MKKVLLSVIFFATLLFAQNQKSYPEVLLHTNMGDIVLQIRPDIAPLASENFLTHVKNGYYNGTIFHRVIEDFMIQGGDPTGTGRGGESIWGKPFKDEFAPNVVFDKPGILAMANAGPGTNRSQFFITTVPTPWLNGRHTIFGYVKKGMDVVTKISETGVDRYNRPVSEVKILKAE
ncbi:MAG: peptidylprolyl isomerase, partial [Hydrogenimonas sp.]|nr:peptidylprolyl isomerase [Hydrogenimonas sp.]